MATILVKRDYKLTDPELAMFASNLASALTRDLSDFAFYGLTAEKIAQLTALCDEFEMFPTDASLVGDVMMTTEARDALRVQLAESVRSMALRVEQKWGVNSGRYKRLDMRPTAGLTDENLLYVARSVHTKVSEYLADLSSMGLTQAMLDDLKKLYIDFEKAKNAQADANAMREDKTVERIELGNKLYALVADYCELGKNLFEKTNPAKYNQYVIYSPGAGPLKPPTGLKYLTEHNTAVWDAVENATSYELEYSPDEKKWIVAFAGADTMVHYFPPQSGTAFFRCRARNANGYGDFSEVVKTEIPMPS